jgi:hypothetical protein
LLFGAGLILISAKLWVFTLSALNTIAAATLGQPASTITYLLFIVLAQLVVFGAIAIRLIVPEHASALLEAFGDWLETHNNQIVLVVSLVFGLLFLFQGISAFF